MSEIVTITLKITKMHYETISHIAALQDETVEELIHCAIQNRLLSHADKLKSERDQGGSPESKEIILRLLK